MNNKKSASREQKRRESKKAQGYKRLELWIRHDHEMQIRAFVKNIENRTTAENLGNGALAK